MLVLRHRKRTGYRWQQRTLKQVPAGPFDLWIQASSGGEANLAGEIIRNLSQLSDEHNCELRLLLTSGTREGIEGLERAVKQNLPSTTHIKTSICCFPFDAPHLRRKAFQHFSPRLAVLLETELWPGYLVAAHKGENPVYLINGRMSNRSYPSYLRFRKFLHLFGPNRIWAISKEDAEKFSQVMGKEKVALMTNIKFDTMLTGEQPVKSPAKLSSVLPASVPFVIFGSIHKEEEEQVLQTIKELVQKRPDAIIGVFPKKPQRIAPWLKRLRSENLPSEKRSQLDALSAVTKVIVWDVFGELGQAYALASAAFVGGSLIARGGQNFLEPLQFGLRPIIGPYYHDFSWVGQEFFTEKLVEVANNQSELTEMLLQELSHPQPSAKIRARVIELVVQRKGGAQFISQQLFTFLTQQ